MTDQSITRADNVFAALGVENPEEHALKAELVVRLKAVMDERAITQTAAARMTGVAQPDLSNLLRGRFKGFSVERLLSLLTALGQDVEIRLSPRPADAGPASVRVVDGSEAA
ncbi:MAG: helix-turn-helix transcriptional regulator [Oceanicaulis sp.]